jgi:hypothetical protein
MVREEIMVGKTTKGIKVLVATAEKQGVRKNDFNWAQEGELVTFGFECDREEIDGECGCKRAFAGVESQRATTTVKVVIKEMPVADLSNNIFEGLVKGGWVDADNKKRMEKHSREFAVELLRIASLFEVGDVIEKRGDNYLKR